MSNIAVKKLETLLRAKQLDSTVFRPWADAAVRPSASSGITALDETLGGGWQLGELSELVGGRSSGRTSVMLATLAAATRRGAVVGLVDAFDRLDPESAAAAGVDLDRVLWVRGAACTVEMGRPRLIEQCVRRALRAFDLIVRAGGFAVVALDVADVPPLFFRALPGTTWMRLARAIEGRESAGLLVGQAPMGRSARGTTIRLEARGTWAGTSLQSRRFQGLDVRAVASHMRAGTSRWMLSA
jgi:hypothetical protein